MKEYHIRVFADRSELVLPDGEEKIYLEGPNNAATQKRYKKIATALERGYLREQIRLCREEPEKLLSNALSEEDQNLFNELVDSMTSEVGRALIGLSVLQLTIKSIDPVQSIRLHKGSSSGSRFGWQEGISMRVLDKGYITPVLREEELLKLNADGFMMTRTLAENYPYTKVYKAAMRGGQKEWLAMVERLETGEVQALPALHYLLSKLLNDAAKFEVLATDVLGKLRSLIDKGAFNSLSTVAGLVRTHMAMSSYAARIMEIAMHALMQAVEEVGALGGASLVPLSQMRSANKKHGNIGDIELIDGKKIIESWDAKYGKTYLRDELEELNDKLETHDAVVKAGFVTSEKPQLDHELTSRISEIEGLHGISISLMDMDDWVARYAKLAKDAAGVTEAEVAGRWIIAYTESLAQKRPDKAPIDEPCYQWLDILHGLLQRMLK